MDGHRTHYSLKVIRYAVESNILSRTFNLASPTFWYVSVRRCSLHTAKQLLTISRRLVLEPLEPFFGGLSFKHTTAPRASPPPAPPAPLASAHTYSLTSARSSDPGSGCFRGSGSGSGCSRPLGYGSKATRRPATKGELDCAKAVRNLTGLLFVSLLFELGRSLATALWVATGPRPDKPVC